VELFVPELSIQGVTAAEGNSGQTDFVFQLTLSSAIAEAATVVINTADGTATDADGDYVAISAATVTIQPGQTTALATVTVSGDTKFEPDETFLLQLSSPSNAVLAVSQATGMILNDDLQPAISIADVSHSEGDAGTTDFVFTVSLSNPSDQPITVDFATA